MAATDVFYRNQKSLNIVFAVSSIAMLVTVVWMFADDFNKSYKKDQRTFRSIEEELNRRSLLAMVPDQAKQEDIVKSEAAVVAAREQVDALKKKVDAKVGSLLPKKTKIETALQNTKADYDAAVSYFNIAVEKEGPSSDDAKKHLATAKNLEPEMARLRKDLEDINQLINQASDDLIEMSSGNVSLTQAERNLKTLDAQHKKLTGDFDRFLKATYQKKWGIADSLRAMPVLDGFASPIKIKQTFHDDLPIDYGGFKYVTRYDRCGTCHLGIDKAAFDPSALARLTLNPQQDNELQDQCRNAMKLLQERQGKNADGTQDVNLLAARDLEPRSINLSPAQIRAFAAHPRLDLFVDVNSPHSSEKFGCTICHSGQGSATSFIDATHSPNDVPTMERWEKDHGWKSIHFWDFPMWPARFKESGCVKCHHQMESLIRDDNRVEAPKLLQGYTLARELGCFGCHEIAGVKSGRWVGPDMRLEPDPPLESLTPAERAKRLADTANPPGTYRKVGPSLARLAEKTNEEWTAKWIKAPRVFRPDTKMPHFYLQANNVPEVLPDDQKRYPDAEVQSITHYLFAKSKQHLQDVTAATKRSPDELAADQKSADELTAKLAKADEFSEVARKAATRRLAELKTRIAAAAQSPPVADAISLPPPPPNEAAAKAQLDRGRQLFSVRGCVACHKHDAAEQATQTADGKPMPAIVGESNFGPNLSKIAAKFVPTGNADAGRSWLVAWLLNPSAHSSRTLMPSVHLTGTEAVDVATWLLAQTPKPDAEWDALIIEKPATETLQSMVRMHLRKAGLLTKEVESAVKDGFTKDQLANKPDDSDEQMLSAPIDDNKLMNYIGKKAIGNLGCFGCHTISGFESAKTIGVGLNDWGKKDVDRIAYEDAENYVKERFHIADLRDDPKDRNRPAEEWVFGTGERRPLERFAPYDTSKQPPYERFFSNMLDHTHRQREGFLHLKLMTPRAYDYNRVRDWNDLARMPQFKFARTEKKADESEDDYRRRAAKEEAEAREAVMTFVLGLIAEPIPPKFVHQPTGDRLAEINGRHVLEKFNCSSCHLVRPGLFEFKLTDDKVTLADGSVKTARQAVMDTLTELHKAYLDFDTTKTDRPYPDHSSWSTPLPAQNSDRLQARAVPTMDGEALALQLTSALTFWLDNPETKQKTAASIAAFGVPLPMIPGAVKELGAPFGGTFARALKVFLSEQDKDVYGDVTPGIKIDDGGKAPYGYAAIPPALIHVGERLQPDWVFQFLLNPKPVRKMTVLQMPKFNMSEDEARTLVNYFNAVSRMRNPGIGLTEPYSRVEQRDEAYLLAKTKEYVARLKANNLFDARVQEMKPLWTKAAKEAQAGAEQRLAIARATNDDAKAQEAQKEIDAWKSQISSGEFPSLRRRWEEKEAYVADAWRLMTYKDAQCTACHQVGSALPTAYQAPNMHELWDRLRPEFTEKWIVAPQRLMPYTSLMVNNYKPDDVKKHAEENKVFVGNADDMIRASRDLIMMFPLVADWSVIKDRPGGSPPPAVGNK